MSSKNQTNKTIDNKALKNKNEEVENENDDNPLVNDKSLQVLRIEINRSKTVFLYYRVYPQKDSKKYPQNRSALFFFFDDEDVVNEKFIRTYLSIAGEITQVDFGKYLNKKGCKKKRKLVKFAIVVFSDEDGLKQVMDRVEMQIGINNVIEKRRAGREVTLNYNIENAENLDEDGEEIEENDEEEEDEDGFVEITARNPGGKRFSKNGLSFKIDRDTEEKKKKGNDLYYNVQFLDKKRQSKYNYLISL